MTIAAARALRYRWLIFATIALGYILVYFHRLCPAVVAEDMRMDLNASGTLLGLLGSAYFYPYAVMQLPAGLLSDSWGPRRTITVFFALAFIGSMILGASGSVGTAILGRTLVGFGVAMLFVPAMKILAEWFKHSEFAFMTGILIAMGGVGSVTATSPLALLSRVAGWRGSFYIVGAATALLAAAVYLIVRDRPSDMGLESPAEHRRGDKPTIGLWEGVRIVLGTASFWPLAIWFFFGCAVFFAFIGLWGGPYLQNIFGLTKTQAGNVLIWSALGMIVGSPALSFISDRVIKARKPLLVISAAMTVLLAGTLAFLTGGLKIEHLYVLCFLFGMFTNAIVVIGFTATKELFPVRIAGTSTGLVNLFPFLGGAVLQPVMGYLLERHGKVDNAFTIDGYHAAFLAMFASAVAALIASLFIKETLKGRAEA